MNYAFKTSMYHEILISGLREVALTNCDSWTFNGFRKTNNEIEILCKYAKLQIMYP